MVEGIDADRLSRKVRKRAIAPDEKRVAMANYFGSDQENDIAGGPAPAINGLLRLT